MKFVLKLLMTLSLVYVTSSSALAMPAGEGPGLTPSNPLKTIELQTRHELEFEKRQFQLIPMAVGLWLSIAGESGAQVAIDVVAKSLNAIFSKDPTPWRSGKEKCTISFSTHAGAECKATVSANGVISPRPSNNWNVCPWIDTKKAPPVQYFTAKGVGHYSVQFTATNKHTWSGIKGTRKCVAQVLCNPRITFYQKHHSIVLDTWLSQGDPTHGKCFGDFGGLCGNGPVKNQFRSHGSEMGFDCGVPCEGASHLPSTHEGH